LHSRPAGPSAERHAWLWPVASVAAALLLSALLVASIGASPIDTFTVLASGAFGTTGMLAYLITAWVPVLLCAAGLRVTFSAGLWNIGIEGQILMGAVFATGVMRHLQGLVWAPAVLVVAALAAVAGGLLWALATGLLRLYGRVSEIFGGLGLNFVAGSLTVYLVLGPWKRAGVGSTSGTEPFGPALWLPAVPGFPVSPIEVALALLAIGAVAAALGNTSFGLQLKAVGRNPRAATLMGCATGPLLLAAFAVCGALAGLAGWVLIAGTSARHNLFPLISGGYGFTAILVVLLACGSSMWTVPISFALAAISMGSLELSLERQLDSSLGGVIEGFLVLAVLVSQGIQSRVSRREV
jgi:general nucleoside transport system permease protein